MGLDKDQDGVFDSVEASLGLDPTKADTDGDGESDSVELQNGTDPTDPLSTSVSCHVPVPG